MTPRWEFVSGADLEDAYVRQIPLSELVPDSSAIYIWRRLLQVPPSALQSSEALMTWLDDAMQAPNAEVHDRRLSHFAVLDHLTIRGSGITQTKRQQFGPLTSTHKARDWLAKYVQGVGRFSPPLYCGETSDLSQRSRDHLSGDTDFGKRIKNGAVEASWPDLELGFCSLGTLRFPSEERATQLRQLLELVTTAFALSGYVSRRG